MKIIVSSSPLIVEDKEGNVLFQYIPKDNKINTKLMTDKEIANELNRLSEKHIKTLSGIEHLGQWIK